MHIKSKQHQYRLSYSPIFTLQASQYRSIDPFKIHLDIQSPFMHLKEVNPINLCKQQASIYRIEIHRQLSMKPEQR